MAANQHMAQLGAGGRPHIRVSTLDSCFPPAAPTCSSRHGVRCAQHTREHATRRRNLDRQQRHRRSDSPASRCRPWTLARSLLNIVRGWPDRPRPRLSQPSLHVHGLERRGRRPPKRRAARRGASTHTAEGREHSVPGCSSAVASCRDSGEFAARLTLPDGPRMHARRLWPPHRAASRRSFAATSGRGVSYTHRRRAAQTDLLLCAPKASPLGRPPRSPTQTHAPHVQRPASRDSAGQSK